MGRNWRTRVAAGAVVLLGAALAGCPTVDLGDTPADIGLCNPAKGEAYFESDIWPKFIQQGGGTNSCVRSGCHDEAGGNALSFTTMPVDNMANYRAAQVYLNCGTPEMSQLLTKPLQGVDDPHGGGNIFTSISDPVVQDFLDWFQ